MVIGWLNANDWNAVWLSIVVAVCAASVAVAVAIPLAAWLATTKSKMRWMIETVVNLPLVLPPVVTGFFLLVLFSPRGWIGGPLNDWFGVQIVLTWWAVLLAAVVVSFPLAIRPVQLTFQQADSRLVSVARTLGATRWAAFCRVSLPLASPGIAAGWLLAFARSLGEFGATIMVAGNILGETRTIPLAIYSHVNTPDGIQFAWPLVIVSVLLACLALIAGQWIDRSSRQAKVAVGGGGS